MKGFMVAGGSVPGTDHTRPGTPGWTNNHDAFAWHSDEDILVAAVCDGCGSTPHPEVGAKLASRMALKIITTHIRVGLWEENPEIALKMLQGEMVANLRVIAHMLADREFESVVANDHFLFTLLLIVMTEKTTRIITFGDGVFVLNGVTRIVVPAVGNAPPYIGQGLVPGAMPERYLHFTLQTSVPTKEVESVLIGTDGANDLMDLQDHSLPGKHIPVGEFSQFWTENRYVENPDSIRRHLALANLETIDESGERPRIKKGLLHDDTTVVVVRRMKGA